jgi:hypothetical protein
MFKPNSTYYMTPSHLTDLIGLSDRLYCAWQCSVNGRPDWMDHDEMIGRELSKIWEQLYDIIDAEQARLAHLSEEMKKFEQGFGYRPPREMKEMVD